MKRKVWILFFLMSGFLFLLCLSKSFIGVKNLFQLSEPRMIKSTSNIDFKNNEILLAEGCYVVGPFFGYGLSSEVFCLSLSEGGYLWTVVQEGKFSEIQMKKLGKYPLSDHLHGDLTMAADKKTELLIRVEKVHGWKQERLLESLQNLSFDGNDLKIDSGICVVFVDKEEEKNRIYGQFVKTILSFFLFLFCFFRLNEERKVELFWKAEEKKREVEEKNQLFSTVNTEDGNE